MRELGRYTDLRTAVLVGGDSMEAQFAELAANPDILLATPGAQSACDLLTCTGAIGRQGLAQMRQGAPLASWHA